jgi:hypothetical protein
MVNAVTGLDGRKGFLSLRGGRLVFDPESKGIGQTEVPVSDIRRVRRVRGTPVLEIALGKDAGGRRMGFYFIEPPSLEEGADMTFFKTRRIRKKSLNTLRGANIDKKVEINNWVRDIQEAKGP